MNRLVWNIVALMLVALYVTAPLVAQAATGEMTVVVTNAATHAPVPGARVVLVGPVFHITVSNATGIARFGAAARRRLSHSGHARWL